MPNVNGYEYRVRWLRVGGKVKTRIFQNLWRARRFVGIMGPEPWVALGLNPDIVNCCDGRECGCEGKTNREYLLGPRNRPGSEHGIPPLMFAEIQRRKVAEWEAQPEAATTSGDGPRRE